MSETQTRPHPSKHPAIFALLASPFEPEEVKVRQQAGRNLRYVTARTVMNRLDNVLGPENWWDDYAAAENSVFCRLTVRLPDGTTITKCDAGGYAGMSDSGDDDKSGYSDAFKRAAVKFGVARYLYRDGVPDYAGEAPAPAATATDTRTSVPAPQRQAEPPRNGQSPPSEQRTKPRTGRAMFAWTKDMEQKHEVGLLKYLNNWAKLQEFPGRMVDWDEDQVALAYAEACRKLQAVETQHADAGTY